MEHAPLMLSVSGLRGLIGQSLTPAVAARFAAAFGAWAKAQAAAPAPLVVIGRDSRPSGPMLELAALAGLISSGCRVVNLGLATTPGVAVMTQHLYSAGGMVITASHNPIIWNGLKCLRHDGVAPPADQAQQIIAGFQNDAINYVPVEQLQPFQSDDSTARVHIGRILKLIDARIIRPRRLKVVLDSVCGAGGPSTALLLEELGVELVHIHAAPTGLFPHSPEPTRENLTGLCAAVRQHQADIGFAQDPDADRLAVVDETGAYLGEEYTLALAALHVLSGGAGAAGPRAVAANLSTSRMIDDIAQRFDCRVLRTPVGEANVAEAMRAHHAILGGEGNGGVILPQISQVRDSLAGIALLLEMLARREQPLSAIAGAIPGYAIVKDKVNIQPGLAERLAPILRDKFTHQKIDLQDGVRIDWPDRWVHIRPSNTEPIIRIIAEARSEEEARRLVAQVRAAVGL